MKQIARKYRFYPNEEQAVLLSKTFGCVRFVWNNILDWRSKEYSLNQTKINYLASSKQLTALKQKEEYSWLKEVSSVPLQQALRNQDIAFRNFFKKQAKYPKFKNKHGKQSITLASNAFTIKDGNFFIAKSKSPLDIRISRQFPEKINSATISKDCLGRYHISLQGEMGIKELPQLNNSVGIDLGLTHFAITSDGLKIEHPKFLRNSSHKLAKLQRKLAKKAKGSKNRNKARIAVAKCQAKIADKRKDFLHKLSTRLIRENQTISIEDLSVAGMVKNRCLAKSISDSGWGEFVRQLEYKADWYGRTAVKINRFFPSSQICSVCDHRDGKKALSIREWVCPSCGAVLDRDINAAKNIDTAGLAEINDCQI